MSGGQRSSWGWLFSCCIVEDPKLAKPPMLRKREGHTAEQSPFQRLGLPDPSYPNSLTLSEDLSISLAGSNIHSFCLQELKLITQSFSSSNFLGEGGFGPVHKGFIDDRVRPGLKAQPVAVKLLDLDGAQGHREWLAEVILLGQMRHPHLVKLIGYCCEDEHRLLVYEYMPRGSLENQLFRSKSPFSSLPFPSPSPSPLYSTCQISLETDLNSAGFECVAGSTASLPWLTRIKIAIGAAKGLAFLHEADKPVIYRDFKASNILLDSDFTAKLSDFGLAKDGPEGDDTHVSTRVMGTQGYAAPEYIMTGHLTAASDVYSFGVVLLELLTGRRSMDKTRPAREQNLADWVRPQLNNPKRLTRIMDPRLESQYSETGARKAAALAYQCLSLRPKNRPTMSVVVKTLEPLFTLDHDIPSGTFVYTVPTDNVAHPSPDRLRKREPAHTRHQTATDKPRGRSSRSSTIYSHPNNVHRNLRNGSHDRGA
ncbi:hypothetical protein V2J09_018232 [Rumex salicifolius]